ncbi:hypothetical protein TcasGA2_TC007095 [Tribolium castaneum]|uniref:Uncharacterized protein n=1 Tax=Tribolium castaneum TaxID=7070 RepID=D2A1I3_TRICA|nr:hypothetical protein TcasGA2_TC007095 [Tribolium castaneum]
MQPMEERSPSRNANNTRNPGRNDDVLAVCPRKRLNLTTS